MPYRYLLAIALLVACADDTTETDDGGVTGQDGGAAAASPTPPSSPRCPVIDRSITQLMLFEEPAPVRSRAREEGRAPSGPPGGAR